MYRFLQDFCNNNDGFLLTGWSRRGVGIWVGAGVSKTIGIEVHSSLMQPTLTVEAPFTAGEQKKCDWDIHEKQDFSFVHQAHLSQPQK